MTPEEREKLTPEGLKTLDIADQLDLVRTSTRLDLHREIAGNLALHLARLEEQLCVAQSGTVYEAAGAAELEAKLKAALEELEIARAAAKIDGSCFVAMNDQIKAATQERDNARKEAHDDREQKREALHKLRLTEDELKKREIRLEDAAKMLDKARREAENLQADRDADVDKIAQCPSCKVATELQVKVKALEGACAASTKAHDEIASRLSAAHKDAAGWEAWTKHQFARAEEATRLLQESREECGTLRAQLAEATGDAQRWQEQAKNVGRACGDNCDAQIHRLKRRHKRRIRALKMAMQRLARSLQSVAVVVELVSR